MSKLPLTGYDNRDAMSGERDQEVYLYDAATNELTCASCNPSGARPVGHGRRPAASSRRSSTRRGSVDGAADRGAPARGDQDRRERRPPSTAPAPIHDDGRLYFNALDSLVPADSNGNSDVYQYEPEGTGSCSASSSGASLAHVGGGCVSLISSGASSGGAAFLDASESEGGSDVFFLTDAQLSVTDEDHVTDIYDARVDGEPAVARPLAECQGEACQPPATLARQPRPRPHRPSAAPATCAKAARGPAAAPSPRAVPAASPAAPRRCAGRPSAPGRPPWAAGQGALAARARRQSRQASHCRRRAEEGRGKAQSQAQARPPQPRPRLPPKEPPMRAESPDRPRGRGHPGLASPPPPPRQPPPGGRCSPAPAPPTCGRPTPPRSRN